MNDSETFQFYYQKYISQQFSLFFFFFNLICLISFYFVSLYNQHIFSFLDAVLSLDKIVQCSFVQALKEANETQDYSNDIHDYLEKSKQKLNKLIIFLDNQNNGNGKNGKFFL